MKNATEKTTTMTLREASQELGLHYEHFLTRYTAFCLENGITIYNIPGMKKKLLNRAEFFKALNSYAIN